MKNLVKVILGIAAVIGIGGVAALATQTWSPAWSPFRQEPTEVVKNMPEKMAEVKTQKFDMLFSLEATGIEDTGPFGLSFLGVGEADKSDPENIKSFTNFTLTFNSEEIQGDVSGEMIGIGDISYFKLTAFPDIPELEEEFLTMGISFAELKNNWIKFDPASLKDWMKAKAEEMGEEWSPEMENQFGNSLIRQKELQEKFEELTKGKEFFIVKEELPDGKINKKSVYHYDALLNKQELKNLIPEIFNIAGEIGLDKEMEGMSEIEKEMMYGIVEGMINRLLNKVGDVNAELWIGKKDNLLYRTKGEKEINLSEFDESLEGNIMIKFDFNNFDFNKSLDIKEPQESMPLQEILENFFTQSQRTSNVMAKDARAISDMSQIRTTAEIAKGDEGSYANIRCEGGNTDMKILCDDIKEMTGSKPIIHRSSAGDKYCAYIELNSGKFWCIDSKLRSIQSSVNPGNKGYCDGTTFICP